MFLIDIKALNLPTKYLYNYTSELNPKTNEFERVKTSETPTGGYIQKNGIVYSFKFDTDGYIKQEIRINTYPNPKRAKTRTATRRELDTGHAATGC